MNMVTIDVSVQLEKQECGVCGGVFALNKTRVDYARLRSGEYYCPYCKTRYSWKETEEERLRKRLEEKERELRQSKCETLAERQLREKADKLVTLQTRTLKRTRNGVCECCNRSFQNLARHMKTKHPTIV